MICGFVPDGLSAKKYLPKGSRAIDLQTLDVLMFLVQQNV
jgi:hypothetical protein